MDDQLVVVGGSVATTAFLDRMRELDDPRAIVVVDGDHDAPYDRPPLSKHYLVEGDVEDIAVDWSDLDATLIRGWAVEVRPDDKVLVVQTEGEDRSIPYGTLIIATGATPIRLPIEPDDTLTLRSAQDARNLREHARAGGRAIIIGAGAIGVELASSLAARDVEVILLDRATGPLERLLAGHLADDVTGWLQDAAVVCHWGVDIAQIARSDAGWQVTLAGGIVIEADMLVSAVGARPNVAWLDASTLLTDGMLIADDDGRIVSALGIVPDHFAMGDVVVRRRADGTTERTESWAAARQHGARLAEQLCGVAAEPQERPYFWTQVAGRKVQVVGTLVPGMNLEVEFENPERGAVLLHGVTDEAEAWIGVNAQPRIAKLLMQR